MSSYTFGRCLKLIRYRKVGLQMTLDFTTEMTAREGRATQRVSTISSQHGHDFSKKINHNYFSIFTSPKLPIYPIPCLVKEQNQTPAKTHHLHLPILPLRHQSNHNSNPSPVHDSSLHPCLFETHPNSVQWWYHEC